MVTFHLVETSGVFAGSTTRAKGVNGRVLGSSRMVATILATRHAVEVDVIKENGTAVGVRSGRPDLQFGVAHATTDAA